MKLFVHHTKKKLLMRPDKTIDQITGIRIIINKITFYIDH